MAAIFGAVSAARYLQHEPEQKRRLRGVRAQPGWYWKCGLPLLLGGAAQGLAAHLKIYPVVHLPGLLYFLGPCLASACVARSVWGRTLPAAFTAEVAFISAIT